MESPGSKAHAALDPHVWLEEVEGVEALAWVRAHNAATLAELEGEL